MLSLANTSTIHPTGVLSKLTICVWRFRYGRLRVHGPRGSGVRTLTLPRNSVKHYGLAGS